MQIIKQYLYKCNSIKICIKLLDDTVILKIILHKCTQHAYLLFVKLLHKKTQMQKDGGVYTFLKWCQNILFSASLMELSYKPDDGNLLGQQLSLS